MLQLKNNTPFAAAIALFPNEQGVDTLYTMVKASFRIGQQWTLVEEQLPPQQEDVHWGEPGTSSLRYASDYHTGKSATDIVLQGFACAPQQQAVRQLDVKLAVGSRTKNIRVFGDRFWDNGNITTPEPFTTMPLVYERAFGGMDIVDGLVRSAEARNPVGLGFCGKKKGADLDRFALPNLESPHELITSITDTPAPTCFGPIAASWQPRLSYAGTYDERWQQNRAPFLPDDYNPRFMNSAHPDLIYPAFMQGGEPISITGMHPAGDLNFTLPSIVLRNRVELGNQVVKGEFMLESVILEPNQLQLSMVWRSAFVCDKKAQKIDHIVVNMLR